MSELMLPIAVNLALGVMLLGLFLWRRRPAGVTALTADEALALFRLQYPEAGGAVTLADDRCCALIELEPGIGLLQRQGRRWVARVLKKSEVASVRLRKDGAIQVGFADFGWPRALVRLDDPNVRASWLERLERLAAPDPNPSDADWHHA
jgi:hypothetical protein